MDMFNLFADHLFVLLSNRFHEGDEEAVALLSLFSWVCFQAGKGGEFDKEMFLEVLTILS